MTEKMEPNGIDDLNGALRDLAGRTRGPVYGPGTGGYDAGRTGYQRRTAHRPSLVLAAQDAGDVRAAVEFAAARGLRVALQAGGHGLAGAMEGGVLISTRRMCEVRVDPRARTARVAAGATWQQVVAAAAPYGLAPLSGSSPGVGAVSYTLGGGVGLLARRHGFAADHVRRFDVVTADGRPRRVTAEDEPDLFWALRGGGGNFGAVTEMEIGLVPLTHVYGGGLFFDVERVPHVLAAWRDWTRTVPEEMTSAVAMLPFPDVPGVPGPLRGRHATQIQICFAGPAGAAERLVAPLRALGPRLRDTLREIPYTESATVFEEPDRPHAYRSVSRLLRDLDPAALDTLPASAGPAAPVMCVVGLRHLGGALARPPAVPSAVGHRSAAYSLSVLSPVEPDRPDAPDGAAGDAGAADGAAAVRATHRSVVAPFAARSAGCSLNFSFGPLEAGPGAEGAASGGTGEAVRCAYAPEDHRRLAALKARYDPRMLFHVNHPIPPAGPAGQIPSAKLCDRRGHEAVAPPRPEGS